MYEDSEEYKIFKKKLEEFWSSLTGVQQSNLWCLWDNGIFIDDKYEGTIDKLIVEPVED